MALQGQLAEQERLAAVGEVTVSLHHAILNPLAGVAGAVAVLRGGDLPPAEREQVFAEIDTALKTIEDVVRRLQTLRRASGTPYVGATMMRPGRAAGRARGSGRARRLSVPDGDGDVMGEELHQVLVVVTEARPPAEEDRQHAEQAAAGDERDARVGVEIRIRIEASWQALVDSIEFKLRRECR